MKSSQQDRVTVSINRTIQVKQFEQLNITVGYSVDKEDSETVDQCFSRVELKTVKEFERLMKWMKAEIVK